VKVDVRVVVATHRDLEQLAREGKFRQDLYHRVYVFPVKLPALRERREDIPSLIVHFAGQVCAQNGWKAMEFSAEAVAALQGLAWPGNVRELRNVVERLILLAADGVVDLTTVEMVLPGGHAVHEVTGSLAERVHEFEKEQVLADLKRHAFHMTNAAKALGLERSHLYKKAELLGIDLRAVKAGRKG
jgi:DNA-binding NtrC family response regulator